MNAMKTAHTILSAAALLILSSCSGVKGLQKPEISMPAAYASELPDDSLTIADMTWWEFYADEPLRKIISRTLENNRDLLKAAARVEQMRQLYGIEKVNLTPEMTGTLSADHETTDYGGKSTKKDPEYDLKVPVGWEVNLWGALSWARRQSGARYLASVEDMRAMRMILVAEVAEAYFRLIALDNELDIVKQTLVTRKESLEQARLRFEGGLTSETVYQQAKVEYASTASLVPNLERQISVARNAITLLMGEYPAEELERSTLYLNETLPAKLPIGIPSTLLKRRPDVRAAEQSLAEAMAGVGLSYADRFPRLRITLSGGLENDELSTFFKSPFTYALGSVTGSILDFGRKKKKYQASIAAYEQARYTYEQSVLQAFNEVNNAIVSYRRVYEAAALKADLRNAASKYVQLAHVQYKGGTLNYIDVLDAQRRYFDAQIGLSNALRDEYLAVVALYKALGGGWKIHHDTENNTGGS